MVLIKPVLNSLPIYYMSLFSILKVMLKKIQSQQQRFFWGSYKGGRGIPMVKWQVIQKQKE